MTELVDSYQSEVLGKMSAPLKEPVGVVRELSAPMIFGQPEPTDPVRELSRLRLGSGLRIFCSQLHQGKKTHQRAVGYSNPETESRPACRQWPHDGRDRAVAIGGGNLWVFKWKLLALDGHCATIGSCSKALF
jgi:hypothetical protein